MDNARRSGLVAVVLLVWRGIRVVAAGTGCGRWRGNRARQQLVSVGPASEGRERSCRPATARLGNPGR
jgi:hypothetical protein